MQCGDLGLRYAFPHMADPVSAVHAGNRAPAQSRSGTPRIVRRGSVAQRR